VIADLRALPGGDLVMQGLRDLAAGRVESVEALLVQIARPRLQAAGLDVPGPARPELELALFRVLAGEHPDDAYGQYRSLLRRLASCAAALDHRLHERGA
jgi:hypothetical protein